MRALVYLCLEFVIENGSASAQTIQFLFNEQESFNDCLMILFKFILLHFCIYGYCFCHAPAGTLIAISNSSSLILTD